MSRRRRNSSSHSDFPTFAPMNAHNPRNVPPPLPSKEDAIAEFESMLVEGRFEDFFDLMDSLPQKVKNDPSMRFMYASALMEYGDMDQSGEIFMELEKQYPRFVEVNLPLAMWHLVHSWVAHATRAAQKLLNARDFDPAGKQTAQEIINEARIKLQILSGELNLPLDKVEQACWHDENGQMAILQHNYTETEYQTRQALKIAPRWKSARNNHAYASYFLGKCSEAIAESEGILAEDPVNLHGLKNLVYFHAGLGEEEKAKSYADRFFALWEGGTFDDQGSMESVEILISILAMLEDTDHIWQVYQKYRKFPPETFSEFLWDSFGTAAARLGYLKEAKKLLQDGEIGYALDRNDVSLLEKIDQAIQAKEKKLSWQPAYPAFIMLLPKRTMFELLELVAKIEDRGEAPTPSQQRQIKEIYSRYPFMLQGFKKMLWSEDAFEVGVMGLVYANQPQADAEILRFAQSDCGGDDDRIFSLSKLNEAGRYDASAPMKFWSASKQEWTEIQFFAQQIGEFDSGIKPESLRLIKQAGETKNKEEGIAILRRVLEKDPACAMAWYNLGASLINQGNEEEGLACMKKSVEVDPNYAFGHANLALREALDGNEAAALDHLEVVQKSRIITPDTASISSYAHMVIHIDKNDIEEARRVFDVAKRINPDHKSLSHYEEMLEDAEKFYVSNKFLIEFQRNSRQRSHEKTLNTKLTAEMPLEKCLSQLTNETLSSICEFWRVISYGKKAEMVMRLNERILDADILEEWLKKLNAKETEALQWVLDSGGWCAWNDFARKFGGDLDESPFWKYHEPKTVLGRLKRAALLYAGTLGDQRIVLIPSDLRVLLGEKLNR